VSNLEDEVEWAKISVFGFDFESIEKH